MSAPQASCDVVHLSFKPPYVPGSYNRFLGRFLKAVDRPSQCMVSYGDAAHPKAGDWGARLRLVSGGGLTPGQRLWSQLPERWRGRGHGGTAGRKQLAYLWGALAALRELRPKVVVCYDGSKLGAALKPKVDWPCRFVLAQRGFSYFLDAARAERLYSRASFDTVWVQTKAAYRFDRARVHRYEPSVVVLPNGVDTEAFRPAASEEEKAELRTRFGLPSEAPVVLCLGRLVPKKGAHLLVEAWDRVHASVPEVLLWVVGGGASEHVARLRRTAQTIGCAEAVRFHGAVEPEDVAACYRAADLYAFPSLCAEGQARTLLEALASGLPCVAADRPEARELYRDDEVHFVVDPNIHSAFVTPLVELLTDPARREALGAKGRAAAVARFPESRALSGLRNLLEEQLRLVGSAA